jgi:hypothetical protein
MMPFDRRVTLPGPRLGGSAIYLLMNLPLGIASGTLLVTLISAGVSTAVVWVGLPLSALAVLVARGGARLERARVYVLLGTYIAMPYLPLPESGGRHRWVTRLRDVTTWRGVAYLFLLFPIGIVEFVLVVTFWTTGLGLVADFLDAVRRMAAPPSTRKSSRS